MAGVISGGRKSEIVEALQRKGLLPPNCRRVIIDIEYNNITKIYYECHADKERLSVVMDCLVVEGVCEEK